MFRYRRTIMSAGVLAVSLFYFIYALLCIESRHVWVCRIPGLFRGLWAVCWSF